MKNKKLVATAIFLTKRVWDKLKVKGIRVNAGVVMLDGWHGHFHVTEYNSPHTDCKECYPNEFSDSMGTVL